MCEDWLKDVFTCHKLIKYLSSQVSDGKRLTVRACAHELTF